MKPITIAGFFDELDKLGARRETANWMQSRSGIRPIRVQTLLDKERPIEDSGSDSLRPEVVESAADSTGVAEESMTGGEQGTGEVGKAAALISKERKGQALHGFARARPYVSGAVKAGVPAAVLGSIYGGKRTAKLLGAVGAAAGATNEALKGWAEKNKRRSAARALLGD